MDQQGAASAHPSPATASSSHHHHLDSDSSDLASPSTLSGSTAQLTPDKGPNSSSSSDGDEKDGDTLWADDDEDGQRDVDSGFAASYELQDLSARAGRKSARGLDAEGGEGYAPSGRRRLSESTAASFQLYTPDEEQAVVRKFDRRLVLFLSICYMLSFIDRSSMLCPFHRRSPSRTRLPPVSEFRRLADSAGCRYRQCQNRWHGKRSANSSSSSWAIRVVSLFVLYLVHCI